MERAWFESIWTRTPPWIMAIRMILHSHCWYISIQLTCLIVLLLIHFHTIYMFICVFATNSFFKNAYLYYCWYISIQFTCLVVLLLLQFHDFYMLICISVDTCPYNLHVYLHYFCYKFIFLYMLICIIVDIFPYNWHGYLYYFCYNFIICTCLFVLCLLQFHCFYMFICVRFVTIS